MCGKAKSSSLQILSKIQFLFLPSGVMAEQNDFFSILDRTESTNNYAMGQVKAGLAKPGQAWFAKDQFGGKGQRGKTWESAPGENIILSIAMKPDKAFTAKPFILSALIALICRDFFASFAAEEIKIKWPNDLYWRDRKTGGILIENIYQGNEWQWAIVGIGININQRKFNEAVSNATSLYNITGKMHYPVQLAKELHALILKEKAAISVSHFDQILHLYNQALYKKGELVNLKKENAAFTTRVNGVNEYGQLIAEDVMERKFDVGEVVWVK